MIPNGKGRHYLTLKRLSSLLKGITWKHHNDLYCLNYPESFATKKKLKWRKKVSEDKDFYNIAMPTDDTEILEFNQYRKSGNAPFIVNADLEKIDGSKTNPKNSSTAKVGEHIP